MVDLVRWDTVGTPGQLGGLLLRVLFDDYPVSRILTWLPITFVAGRPGHRSVPTWKLALSSCL